MRFGIKTAPQDTTWPAVLAVWREADGIEVFESAWNFDHFYPIFSDATGPCMEAWVTLSALAQATDRIRVGTMVNGMPYRHPAVLANMASSLDIVSDGRLELGLGAGWNDEEASAYGIDLLPLRDRFDRFEEAVEIVVGLLSKETTTFWGEHYEVNEARNEPKGPQRPHPPIVIGGGGEQRTLRIAARWADHWNLPFAEEQQFAHKLSVLHSHCADIGRDPSEILCSTQLRMEGEPAEVAERCGSLGEVGAEKVIVYLPPPHDPAVVEPLAEALRPLT